MTQKTWSLYKGSPWTTTDTYGDNLAIPIITSYNISTMKTTTKKVTTDLNFQYAIIRIVTLDISITEA